MADENTTNETTQTSHVETKPTELSPTYLSQKKAGGAPWGIMFARTIYDGQYG